MTQALEDQVPCWNAMSASFQECQWLGETGSPLTVDGTCLQLSPQSRCLPQQERHTPVLLRGPSVSKPPAFLPLPQRLGAPSQEEPWQVVQPAFSPSALSQPPAQAPTPFLSPGTPHALPTVGFSARQAGGLDGWLWPLRMGGSHRSPQPQPSSFTGEGEKAPDVLA